MHSDCATQMAFVLGRLLRQDVALERLAALDGTARADAKPLGGTFLGLHLGHDCSLSIAFAGAGNVAVLLACNRFFKSASVTKPMRFVRST